MPAEKTKMKSTKPLMEKRRRARINESLMQLKSLVLDALNKNNPRHSKLEKADILEMTVRYLRTIQRHQLSASVNSDPNRLGQYRSGYAECVNEVTRYLGATSSATDRSPELRTQLVGHLANLCNTNQQSDPMTTPSVSPQRQHHQQQQPTFPYTAPIRQQQPQQNFADASAASSYAEAPPQRTIVVNRMSPSVESTATFPPHRNVISPLPEGARTEYALTAPVYNTHDAQRARMSPSSSAGHVSQTPQNSTRVVVSPPLDPVATSGEITLVLPQQALPNGQLPTHFIPVYAQGPVVVSPATANTSFQTSNTDGSHRSISPSSAASTCSSPERFTPSPQLTSHIQYQTELYPAAAQEHFSYSSSQTANHCAAKKETMWRPW